MKFTGTDKNGKPYGLIERDDNERDLWFRPSMYYKFYGKDPEAGDRANFTTYTNQFGLNIGTFCEPQVEESLPKNEHFGLIDNNGKDKRFSIQEFEEFYNRECNEGDLVYFTEENREIIFKEDDSSVYNKTILIEEVINGTIIYCGEKVFFK